MPVRQVGLFLDTLAISSQRYDPDWFSSRVRTVLKEVKLNNTILHQNEKERGKIYRSYLNLFKKRIDFEKEIYSFSLWA